MKICLKLKSIVAVIVCLLLYSETASATGEIYVRTPSKTNIAECEQGKLTEMLYMGGGVRGAWEDLVIACLNSDLQSASWVLISGTNCFSSYSNPLNHCRSAIRQKIPGMVITNDFWKAEGKSAPFNMAYQLIKWGLGKDCTRIKQVVAANKPGLISTSHLAWLCKELALVDGTEYDKTIEEMNLNVIEPQRFLLTRVETSSDAPLKGGDNDFDPELPTYFIVDSDLYIYSYAHEVTK